ncbi:30S ribosomal protein S9 [Candidatus Bathyarchaeota archaeon]|jgi:small subunit ribosomal protein S9|nr:30S ribosomal protein S9 [Candidatus Bathyarchaeota archaeon]MDP6048373.1 30S ribosomal protein S9 [Candidatus Bathyarchaeota archaeon]MDP6458302.1 30S ribosomal protein S9 [Candidatus Bathyarchaeota archaeon]MDP7207690.1 30S ribosomal protein S9 [Candidatus Bathyarchaeota archaeon]MDP7443529.1 30S ribosomal protein S9 [Candidatus Bathyarchaeota archaeon]|tara:strand:+ start:2289 stop:2699 length:411 start_codon:yes stop_codon:yes gene_type:complete
MSLRKKVQLTVGKRKTSKARVVISKGKGRVRINNIPLAFYQPLIARDKITESIMVAGELAENVDIKVKVHGGGYMSQAEAVRMGIAQSFLKWSRGKKLRTAYLNYDRTMLSGDGRRKEPKKFGGPGARRKKQKSYR